MDKATDRTPLRTSANPEQVRRQVEQVKDVLRDNLDLAIERGANLDQLSDHSQQIEADARTFKQRSNIVKRRSCQAYYKSMALIAVVIIIIIVVIVLIFA